MRIGLTYDLQTRPADIRQAEFDSPTTVQALRHALEELGHDVVLLGNARELLAYPPGSIPVECVLNLAEGTHGRCREAWVPALLEVHGVPYVGSGPRALSLGLDKVMSKRLAVACGVPTPRWIVADHPDRWEGDLALSFPLIVKPRYQGSGMGIDEGAIVHDRKALIHRMRWLFAQWPEALLVEEFIPTGELTVCVLGNSPPVAYPAVQRPLDPISRLSYHVAPAARGDGEAPLQLTDRLEAEARRLACVMFTTLGCHDLARIDFRVDQDGRLWFLEINPLPSFDPEGTFGLLAEYLGITYTQLIGRILDVACQRFSQALDRPSAVR